MKTQLPGREAKKQRSGPYGLCIVCFLVTLLGVAPSTGAMGLSMKETKAATAAKAASTAEPDVTRGKPHVELVLGWRDVGPSLTAEDALQFEATVLFAGISLKNEFRFAPFPNALGTLRASDRLSIDYPWTLSVAQLKGEFSGKAAIHYEEQNSLFAKLNVKRQFPEQGNASWVSGSFLRAVPEKRPEFARTTVIFGAGDSYEGVLPGGALTYGLKASLERTLRVYSWIPQRNWTSDKQTYQLSHPLPMRGRASWRYERTFTDYPARLSEVARETAYSGEVHGIPLGYGWQMRAGVGMTEKRHLFAPVRDKTTFSAETAVERALSPEWTVSASGASSLTHRDDSAAPAAGGDDLLPWRTSLGTTLAYRSATHVLGSSATTALVSLGARLLGSAGSGSRPPEVKMTLRLGLSHRWDEHWVGRLLWTSSLAAGVQTTDGEPDSASETDPIEYGSEGTVPAGDGSGGESGENEALGSRLFVEVGYRW